MLEITSEKDRLLLLKLKDNCGNTLLHHFVKVGIDKFSFSSAFESLSRMQKLRLMDIRNNIGSSPIDECRTQNGLQNQVCESSQWLLRQYSKLRTAAILDESDEKSKCNSSQLCSDFINCSPGIRLLVSGCTNIHEDKQAASKKPSKSFYIIKIQSALVFHRLTKHHGQWDNSRSRLIGQPLFSKAIYTRRTKPRQV